MSRSLSSWAMNLGLLCFLIILLQTGASVAADVELTPGIVQESLSVRQEYPDEGVSLPEVLSTLPNRPAFLQQRKIRVNRFAISGNSVFSEDELRVVVAASEGEDMTLDEIYEQADRLSEYYRERGYTLTTVSVPEQRMVGGVLRLQVVEGRVGKLVFSGNKSYGNGFLARQLNLLPSGAIIRFDDVESELLLLNDMPGLQARSVLRPGEESGTTDINFSLEEKPLTAAITVDNTGRKVIGTWRVGADLVFNNPLGCGDALGLNYTRSQNNLLRQGRVNYSFPLFSAGSRVRLSYSRAEYDVGKEFTPLDIAGVSETAFVRLSHPFLRSRGKNLFASFSIYHVRGQAERLSTTTDDDRINYFDVGFEYSQRYRDGDVVNASAHFATNFRDNSADDDNEALPPRLQLNADYEHFFNWSWSVLTRGEMVFSSDPLPDSNKYSLGGISSVRGFVSSARRGDQGGMGSVEIRGRYSVSHVDLLWCAFADGGKIYYKKSLDDGRDSDSLVSAGVGLKVTIARRFVVDMHWAKPVDGNDAGDDLSAPFWLVFTALY